MSEAAYRSPAEDAAYYASIWGLSNAKMADLERAFSEHEKHAAPSATPQREPVWRWRWKDQTEWMLSFKDESKDHAGNLLPNIEAELYASPHQPDTGMVMIGVSDEVVKLVHDAFREGVERADKPWSPQATAWDQSNTRVRLNAMISAASPLHAAPPIEPERQT